MESICNKWIKQVKHYMQVIGAHSMQGTEVGNILDESLNLSGKMIRAKLLLLCALLGPNWEEKRETLCKLAAMVELTHLASLIHDDIVDDSPYRRGQESIQKKYGRNAAVYAGDFIMARIYYYEAVEHLNDSAALLSKAVEAMCAGEIGQGICRYMEDITPERYFKNIEGKTAALFETACYIGAKEAGCTDELTERLALFGKNIGFMFQIKDDILDFTSTFHSTGKEIHQDFQNGIYTFPVIVTMKNPQGKDILLPIMKANKTRDLSQEEISKAVNCVMDFGGIKESYKKIQELSEINKNLIKDLDNNSEITALFSLLMKALEE
jgi:heptaprenyl diphosphate synthase